MGAEQFFAVEPADLVHLFGALQGRGYTLVGPSAVEGSIHYVELSSPDDLPVGWTDEQDGGTYRLRRRDDAALFGYAVGQHSWKTFLYPSKVRLWDARRERRGFDVLEPEEGAPAYAFIGVRACDLSAIAVLDKVLLGSGFVDPSYRSRREPAVVVAVNCGQAGGTCFCASMGTGPRAGGGHDLVLTEVLEPGRHLLIVEPGSELGLELLREIPHRSMAGEEIVARTTEKAAAEMSRNIETEGIKELLYRSYEHPRWDEVAGRCLTCTNCTMVCPTCFCTTVEDSTDLPGERAERTRRWDSCYALDFSYVHGGVVRASSRSRYRQWLTHKLATWIDQFGTSGCVGCGRCITWCPVAIDITEEVAAIRGSLLSEKERDAVV